RPRRRPRHLRAGHPPPPHRPERRAPVGPQRAGRVRSLAQPHPYTCQVANHDLDASPAASTPAPTPGAKPPMSLAMGLLRTARPVQWSKNVLVFAAPGAAGVLDNREALGDAMVAFVAFCLAASGTYFL